MTTKTPTPWTFTGILNKTSFTLEAHFTRYENNGRPAVLIYTVEESDLRDLFADLSINAPEIMLMDDERQIIINPDVADELLDLVIASGLIEAEPDMGAKIGMAVCPVYSLTTEAAERLHAD